MLSIFISIMIYLFDFDGLIVNNITAKKMLESLSAGAGAGSRDGRRGFIHPTLQEAACRGAGSSPRDCPTRLLSFRGLREHFFRHTSLTNPDYAGSSRSAAIPPRELRRLVEDGFLRMESKGRGRPLFTPAVPGRAWESCEMSAESCAQLSLWSGTGVVPRLLRDSGSTDEDVKVVRLTSANRSACCGRPGSRHAHKDRYIHGMHTLPRSNEARDGAILR